MNLGQRMLVLLAATAITIAGCASTDADLYPPDEGVSAPADVSFFYDSLSPYGRWFEMPPYGWVWSPYDTPVGWRPYSVGYWRDSDYGWMWISEDPWGWAPYHYGRWTYDSSYGWIWIPGDDWAPAWVAWRYGDGWAGWAPLPPEIGWQVGVGLNPGSYDIDNGIEPYRWCFVREGDLVTTRIRSHVVPSSKNVTLVRVTKNVTNYSILKGQPVVQGPDPDVVQRNVGRAIPRYRLVEAQAPPRDRSSVIRGEQIEVYRPPVRGRTPTEKPKPLPRPTVKPVPPDAVLKRQETQRRSFDTVMQRERAQLEQEQQKEIKRPPAGVSMEELRQRQQAEIAAQREKEARERQVLETRSQELQKLVQQRQQEQQNRQEQQRLQQEQRRQQQQQQREQQQQEKERQKEQQKEQQKEKQPRDRGQGQTRDR
jgi:hypothetical protein